MTLVLGSIWIWANRIESDMLVTRSPQPAVGYPAPDFTLPLATDASGDAELTLSQIRGRPVILNFWATWCGPCRAEMPMLQKIATSYADDVLILGIDQGESRAVVEGFLTEFGIDFTILLDGTMQVGNRYNILGLPTTFFIDKDGIIRQVYAGELNAVILAAGIEKIVE